MSDETKSAVADFQTLPGLFGTSGALVFFVTKKKDAKGRPVITPHTRLIESPTGRGAQFEAEQICEELMKKPDVIRIILCAVVAESRRKGEVTPERKSNGKHPG